MKPNYTTTLGEKSHSTNHPSVVIAGPSGAGKDSVIRQLVQLHPERFQFVVTVTTRPPRRGERDGEDYRFMKRAEFEQRIARNQFFEWAEVYGRLYGSLHSTITNIRAAGKLPLMRVDVQGAERIQKLDPNALLISIVPPSLNTLRQWLEGRGDTAPEEMDSRMNMAAAEIARLKKLKGCHTVLNRPNRLDLTVNEVLKVAAHALRTPHDAL